MVGGIETDEEEEEREREGEGVRAWEGDEED